MRALVAKFAVLVILSYAWSTSRAQELGVAAASDLQFVFKDVADRFEKQTGYRLRLSFGSSGNFYAQIQNGAPFDLFFSADMEYPQKLEAEGLAESGSIYEYARGKIILWVPNESPIDVKLGLNALLDPRIHKIAIANPAHAPYGRAAVAALKSAAVYDKISDKLVFGENISQTAHFVASGNADAGILALSTALSPMIGPRGKYFLIPLDSYPPLEQAVIIVKSSQRKQEAMCFLQFIRSPEIVDLLKQYGFELPAPPVNKAQTCACCRRSAPKL